MRQIQKTKELHKLFKKLNSTNQKNILLIATTLKFAQEISENKIKNRK